MMRGDEISSVNVSFGAAYENGGFVKQK